MVEIKTDTEEPQIEQRAREDAEEWFGHLMDNVRMLREYGEATGENVTLLIRGHVIGEYLGDLWNAWDRALLFTGGGEIIPLEGFEELGSNKEMWLELCRRTFLYRLQTYQKAPGFPEDLVPEIEGVIKRADSKRWQELAGIKPLGNEKRRIYQLAKKKWGREMDAIRNRYTEIQDYNAAHGLYSTKISLKLS